MAITYSGSRPVVKGRSVSDFVHPYKGLGTYSNWSIFAGNGPLSGMPELEDHVPGTGRHPHDVQMSRRFVGTAFDLKPMDDPGNGPELTWHFKISELLAMQGEDGQDVFPNGYGHEDRVTSYSQWDPWVYRGVAPAPFEDPGHIQRLFNHGTANWFGATHPFDYGSKGVTLTPMHDPGETLDDKPTGLDHAFQKVNEWKGVPSAQAL